MTRFRPWLTTGQPDVASEAARRFFETAAVILDANVLLDLYRYTKEGREQVLSVLEMIGKSRLWLPHQIGLEFTRNRAKAVQGRLSSLTVASKALAAKFQTVSKVIREARDDIADLVREMTQDDAAADSIVEAMPDEAVEEAFKEWNRLLSEKLKGLRAAEAVSPKVVATDDPLLPTIAALFGESIGDAFPEAVMRDLVDRAVNFRYPNRIPPGFSDISKGTDLLAAGDYIAWEQILTHAESLVEPRQVIFVSGDTKGDWYELDGNGRPIRPWPALHDEMRTRAQAEVLILTPRQFLRGAQEFLDAPVGQGTYADVDRVADHRPRSETTDYSSDSPDGERGRLQRRLQRVLRDHQLLISELEELKVDGSDQATLDDPRSYASALASRAQILSEQARRLEVQIGRD